jgi:hypothetical protein
MYSLLDDPPEETFLLKKHFLSPTNIAIVSAKLPSLSRIVERAIWICAGTLSFSHGDTHGSFSNVPC